MHGCKVLASASSEQKVAFLRDELKVDYAFNYRDGEPLDHLKKGAPEGTHVYFDNTGGPQLEAALATLRNYGRIAMCGGISGYNTPVPGPRNLMLAIAKRLRLEGFGPCEGDAGVSRRGGARAPIRKAHTPRDLCGWTGGCSRSVDRSSPLRGRQHRQDDREAFRLIDEACWHPAMSWSFTVVSHEGASIAQAAQAVVRMRSNTIAPQWRGSAIEPRGAAMRRFEN
jgi:NADPH:quinone reductase-like Zn-dependent oxidoreductase